MKVSIKFLMMGVLFALMAYGLPVSAEDLAYTPDADRVNRELGALKYIWYIVLFIK